jgi:hypothetical protein
MTAIWRDIDIEWGGKRYITRPTIELINRLEQRDGHSIMKLIGRVIARDLPVSSACEIIAIAVTFAGKPITAEEVYIASRGGMAIDVITPAAAILTAIFPVSDEPQEAASDSGEKKTMPGHGETSTP